MFNRKTKSISPICWDYKDKRHAVFIDWDFSDEHWKSIKTKRYSLTPEIAK